MSLPSKVRDEPHPQSCYRPVLGGRCTLPSSRLRPVGNGDPWTITLVALTATLSRRSLIATGALAAGALGASAPTIGTAFGGSPARAAAGVTKKITIYAEQLPGGLFGYGLAPGQATVPGPILEIYEGDTLEITLVNTTNQRLSIHPHGVDYSTDSDGSPLNASFNNPG